MGEKVSPETLIDVKARQFLSSRTIVYVQVIAAFVTAAPNVLFFDRATLTHRMPASPIPLAIAGFLAVVAFYSSPVFLILVVRAVRREKVFGCRSLWPIVATLALLMVQLFAILPAVQ